MLEEFEREILVGAIAVGEPQRHLQYVEAELRHPGGTVGLLEQLSAWKYRTVEGTDVVQAEKSAFEDIVAERVLAVDPPSEVDQQLVEGARKEVEILAA